MVKLQRSLWLALALVLGVAGSAMAQESTSNDEVIKKGREYSEWFLAGETGKLWPALSQEMKDALGSEEALKGLISQLEEQMGKEEEVLEEQVQEAEGYHIYTRTVHFSDFAGPVNFIWTLTPDSVVAGFFIQPK